MIGGTVTDIWRQDEDRVSIAVADEGSFTGIDLVQNENSLSIRHGDIVWWQMDNAYWTPQDRSLRDIPIPRIGYSYVLVSPITRQREMFAAAT